MPNTNADLDPYTYLISQIPTWFSILDSVNSGTPHRRLDAIIPSNGPDPTAPANHASIATLPRNNRSNAPMNGSLDELDEHDEQSPSPRPEEHLRAHPAQPSSSAKRKRGNATSSAHADTNGSPPTSRSHNAYRERNAKLVLFDKEAQSQFEAIVQGITDGKNKIRRSKAAARLADMSHRAAAADESQAVDDDERADNEVDDSGGDTSESISGDKVEKILAAARARRTTSSSSGVSAGGRTAQNLARQKAEVLDRTDKGLLQAQDLCETAAFQLLRDGDCRIETRFIREKLQDVLEVAKEEASRLKEGMGRRRSRGLSLKKDNSGDTIVPQDGSRDRDDLHVEARMSVDDEDDDDDDDDMPLPPVRLTSKMKS